MFRTPIANSILTTDIAAGFLLKPGGYDRQFLCTPYRTVKAILMIAVIIFANTALHQIIIWPPSRSGRREVVAVYPLYEGKRHFIKILNTEHYAPLYVILNRLEVQR